MFKLKNISKTPISLFYVKGGKNTRGTLGPGQELLVDEVKTPQIVAFENSSKISVTKTDSVLPPNNTVIKNNAILPNKKKDIEEISKSKKMEMYNLLRKNISEVIKETDFDYKEIINSNVSVINNDLDFYDISVIIPVRGRNEFAQPMYDSFLAAKDKVNMNIAYTMVEHSENPQHSKFCKKNGINYIWIKSEPQEMFNKCLAQNMGAFFSVKSKYLLFHDIDCLMQSDFFVNLLKNIELKEARAIQNFTGRRVLYISPSLTAKVISKEFDIDNLNISLDDVSPPSILGAPGGSITIERDLFFEIGGYDPELFLANSPEDAFFWEKIDTIDKMHICDSPEIELYHMHHPPTWMHNPYIREMEALYNSFKNLDIEGRKELIKLKSEKIQEFK